MNSSSPSLAIIAVRTTPSPLPVFRDTDQHQRGLRQAPARRDAGTGADRARRRTCERRAARASQTRRDCARRLRRRSGSEPLRAAAPPAPARPPRVHPCRGVGAAGSRRRRQPAVAGRAAADASHAASRTAAAEVRRDAPVPVMCERPTPAVLRPLQAALRIARVPSRPRAVVVRFAVHPVSQPRALQNSASVSVIAIIPARYQSTRLPGKALADIGGRPMIEHVYRRAAAARSVSSVIVATDDERIIDAVRGLRRRGAHDVAGSPERHRSPRRSRRGRSTCDARRQRAGRRAADRAGDDRRGGRAVRCRSDAR